MTTVGTGKHTYRLIQDWAKVPPGESLDTVSAVATDSQDLVYVFQRKDPRYWSLTGMVTNSTHGAIAPSQAPTASTSPTTSFTSLTGMILWP